MKNYKEVADSVFKRSEEIIVQNKKRRRERLMSIGATAGCLIVAGAVGIGVWKNMGRADIPVASDIDPNWSSASRYVNSTTTTIDNIYDSSTASSKNDTANGAVVSGEVGVTSVAESSTENVESDKTDIVSNASGSGEVGVTSNAESSTKTDIVNSVSGSGEVGVTSIPESSAESVESNTANSAPESSAETSDNDSAVNFPANNEPDTNALSGTPLKTATVIEEYESNVVTDYIGTPENGTYRVSDDLREAMEEYGYTDGNGDIVYHVMAYYYENGTPVDVSVSAICDGEWNRLCGHGYHCEYETCGRNWGAEYDNHFCMRLTREQIENFTPAGNLGCELCLYCEGKQRCILANPDINYSSSTSTPIVQNPGYHHGYGYGAGDGTGYGYGNGNGYGNSTGCGTGYGHHHGGC